MIQKYFIFFSLLPRSFWRWSTFTSTASFTGISSLKMCSWTRRVSLLVNQIILVYPSFPMTLRLFILSSIRPLFVVCDRVQIADTINHSGSSFSHRVACPCWIICTRRAHSVGGPGVGEGPQEQSGQNKQVRRRTHDDVPFTHKII